MAPLRSTLTTISSFGDSWSLCTFGVGLVGLLAPAIVYPSEMVYWGLLPLVTTFQALHYQEKDENKRRVRVFGWCLLGAFTWEIVPAWMMPWLNGISIPCLASMKAPQSIRKVSDMVVSRLYHPCDASY